MPHDGCVGSFRQGAPRARGDAGPRQQPRTRHPSRGTWGKGGGGRARPTANVAGIPGRAERAAHPMRLTRMGHQCRLWAYAIWPCCWPGWGPSPGGDGAPLRGCWDGSRSATAVRLGYIRGGARRLGGLCRRGPSAHRTQPAARPNIGLLLTLIELLDVVDAIVSGTTCVPLSTCPHHHPLPHSQPFLFRAPSNRHEALLWRSIRPAALDGLYRG